MLSLQRASSYSVVLYYAAVVALLCFFYVKLLDDWQIGLKTTIEVENISKNKAAYNFIDKLQKERGLYNASMFVGTPEFQMSYQRAVLDTDGAMKEFYTYLGAADGNYLNNGLHTLRIKGASDKEKYAAFDHYTGLVNFAIMKLTYQHVDNEFKALFKALFKAKKSILLLNQIKEAHGKVRAKVFECNMETSSRDNFLEEIGALNAQVNKLHRVYMENNTPELGDALIAATSSNASAMLDSLSIAPCFPGTGYSLNNWWHEKSKDVERINTLLINEIQHLEASLFQSNTKEYVDIFVSVIAIFILNIILLWKLRPGRIAIFNKASRISVFRYVLILVLVLANFHYVNKLSTFYLDYLSINSKLKKVDENVQRLTFLANEALPKIIAKNIDRSFVKYRELKSSQLPLNDHLSVGFVADVLASINQTLPGALSVAFGDGESYFNVVGDSFAYNEQLLNVNERVISFDRYDVKFSLFFVYGESFIYRYRVQPSEPSYAAQGLYIDFYLDAKMLLIEEMKNHDISVQVQIENLEDIDNGFSNIIRAGKGLLTNNQPFFVNNVYWNPFNHQVIYFNVTNAASSPSMVGRYNILAYLMIAGLCITLIRVQLLAEVRKSKAVQASENKLHEFLDSNEDAIIQVSKTGRIHLCNQRAKEMLIEKLRFNGDSSSIDTINRLFPTINYDFLQQYDQMNHDENNPHSVTWQTTSGEKKQLAVRIVKSKIQNYYTLYFSDLSKHQSMLKQVHLLERIVEQTNASIVITDISGDIEYVNDAFCKHSGYTRKYLLGKNPRVVKSGLTPEATYRQMWNVITSGKHWRGELCNRRKNGELYWESSIISPIIDEDKNIVQFLAVKEEITARKLIEFERNKFKQLFEKAESLGEIGSWEWNLETDEVVLSKGMSLLLGLSNKSSELPFDEAFFHLFKKEKVYLYQKKSDFISNMALDSFEVIVQGDNGQPRTLIVLAKPQIRTESTTTNIVFGIARNITKEKNLDVIRKKQEDELYKARIAVLNILDDTKEQKERADMANVALAKVNVALAKADQAKSLFLATMSHEIRTPLNAIIGMLELLESKKLVGEKRERFLKIAKHSGLSLLEIINDILDFSKIEAGKMTLELLPFCIKQLVDEAVMLQIDSLLTKNIKVYCFYPLNDYKVVGDPTRIRQMVLNLLSNAIKFTRDSDEFDATIIINVTLDKGTHENDEYNLGISVIDSGIGISPEKFSKLFTSFTQLDEGTARQYGGTGLGLSICDKLSRLMNGRIRCESTEGVGSNFTIDIPVTIEGLDVQKIPACQVHVLNCPEPISPYLSAVSAFSNVEIVHHDTYEAKGSDNGLYLVFEDMDKQWREAVKNSSRQFIFVSNNMIENRTQPNVFVMESNPFLTSELDVRIRTSLLGSEEKQDSGKAKGKKKEQLLMSGHILIVEDNAYNQELLISQLELLGCKSSVAVNGAQALEILENNKFDIILTDCHMPVMDGFEFIQRLRAMEANDSQLTKHIVIAATANSSIEEKNKCIEYGMDDFISKPISLKNLTRLIKHYLPSNMSSTDIIQLDKNEIVSAGIDPSVLAQYIGDDIAIQKQFLQTFIRLSADIVEQLNIAFDKSDMKTIKQLGHKFKSSLKSVGANALVELCHQLEHQTAIDLSLKVKLNQHYEDLMVAAKSFINQC